MSEQSLDKLIAKVKTEAIDEAEEKASQIIYEANEKAKEIIAKAISKKGVIISDAEKEADNIFNKGKVALKQAERDLQISLRNDIISLFKTVLDQEVKDVFTADLYTKIILHLTSNLGDNIQIALPEDETEQLVESIKKKVSTSNSTVDIIKKNNLFSGLSITKINEGWSYDITANEISELLSKHLSSKWSELLKNT